MKNPLSVSGVDLCAHFGGLTNALEVYFVIRKVKPVARVFVSNLEKLINILSTVDGKIKYAPSDFIYQFKSEKIKNGYSNKFNLCKKRNGDIPEGYVCPIYISLNEDMAKEAQRADGINSAYLGLLLGYPQCCIDFYHQNSSRLSNTSNDYVLESLTDNSYISRASFVMNFAVRYYGYSLLSHFSCSLRCHDSMAIAKVRYEMILDEYPNLAKELRYHLSCMVLYSEKHGIFYAPEYEIMDNHLSIIKYRDFMGTKSIVLNRLRHCNELRVGRDERQVLLSDGTALQNIDAIMCFG